MIGGVILLFRFRGTCCSGEYAGDIEGGSEGDIICMAGCGGRVGGRVGVCICGICDDGPITAMGTGGGAGVCATERLGLSASNASISGR